MRSICVFCGSKSGRRSEYLHAVSGLARVLVDEGVRVVYGGASVGTMGALADGVIEAGGEVVGVIPRLLDESEIAHTGLTELHTVGSMHERKALMVELSDGFIALPGGLGTLDELAEVATWAQLGIHSKPIGLLNVMGYFDDLLRYLDGAVEEEFLSRRNRELLLVDSTSQGLLGQMKAHIREISDPTK